MAAPKGNKNAVGNSGGGRKSAYEELADALEAHKMFFEPQSQEEIEERIRSGHFSLADRAKLNAMEGDTAMLLGVMKKALPDVAKIDHTSKGEKLPTPILGTVPKQDE